MRWLLTLLLATSTVTLQESGRAKVGSAAPTFGGWELAGRKVLTLDGLRRTPSLAPLLITFGASFCKPCNEGIPRLKALASRRDLRLVLIDVEADAEKAQQFAARMGLSPELCVLDKFEQIARTYGVTGPQEDGTVKTALPRTFLVDAMGKVRGIYREEGDDLEAVIEVRDTGAGIDPAVLPRIFDLYTQAGPPAARSPGSLGIGLSLVKQFAELHGGCVTAHSPGAGEGATFIVRLPRQV